MSLLRSWFSGYLLPQLHSILNSQPHSGGCASAKSDLSASLNLFCFRSLKIVALRPASAIPDLRLVLLARHRARPEQDQRRPSLPWISEFLCSRLHRGRGECRPCPLASRVFPRSTRSL